MKLSSDLLTDTLWDVFLAVVPVALAFALAAGIRRTPGWRAWLWLPLGLAWFFFLPNTCYLLTEIRHYLALNPFSLIGPYAGHAGIKRFLFWSGFWLVFSGSGVLLFALAIRPVVKVLAERGMPPAAFLPLLFLCCSLGVYMGLRLRFNSWDMVRQPSLVVNAGMEALAGPGVAGSYIVAFALFLWLAYVVVDIWFDGVLLRWERWRLRARYGARVPPASAITTEP